MNSKSRFANCLKAVINWRYWALMVLFAVSLCLLLGESDNLLLMLACKAAAMGGFALYAWQLRRWG